MHCIIGEEVRRGCLSNLLSNGCKSPETPKKDALACQKSAYEIVANAFCELQNLQTSKKTLDNSELKKNLNNAIVIESIGTENFKGNKNQAKCIIIFDSFSLYL